MKEKLKAQIKNVLTDLGINAENISLEFPGETKNGDYSTNVALAYAKQYGKSPRDLAEKISDALKLEKPEEVERIEIAGPGFINFHFSKEFFIREIGKITSKKDKWGENDIEKGKRIMVEYTDPNPFKPFHIGHLMTNAIGESIARIFEYSGAYVSRANYQGDVGLHVAKSIWEIKKRGFDRSLSASESALFIGECYAKASEAYENDPTAKIEIDEINKKIYDKSDSEINDIYDWGKRVTLEAFEDIYKILGTKFEHYFFESKMAPIGEKIVCENIGKVFNESDGAVVFEAAKHDPKLHTRVFITSQKLPTYETKELGLTQTKFEIEKNLDLSIVVTANEQMEYMKVVLKAIELMKPDIAKKMKHITHGMMRFASGKMSSRKGNVVTGESLLRDAKELVFEKMSDREMTEEKKIEVSAQVGVSALKYSILRQAIGGDIMYDFDKSISFDGDSGPYLQYSAVRASSILTKAGKSKISHKDACATPDWTITNLEKYLSRFPEIVLRSSSELEPHHIATYLTELASEFNSFYANHQIVNNDDENSPYKILITEAFLTTMTNGLHLLGISVPEKM